jgi:anaphase-promoting complex subunit 6
VFDRIKAQDAYFKESIPVHLSCLYELGMKNELYEYAQELVDRLNDEAVAWHAVGLYYLYIKKNLEARRYFSQALTINQFFQQSWLGYGHSFSAEKDHDQAISAYMACSRLIPG